jgi:hypothetical protein
MAEDECVCGRREGDCAVWVIFDQDADGHCRWWTSAGRDSAGAASMSGLLLLVQEEYCLREVWRSW